MKNFCQIHQCYKMFIGKSKSCDKDYSQQIHTDSDNDIFEYIVGHKISSKTQLTAENNQM